MAVVVLQGETVNPRLLVEVHQHLLFQLIFPIVDRDGIIVSVQTMDQCLQKEAISSVYFYGLKYHESTFATSSELYFTWIDGFWR